MAQTKFFVFAFVALLALGMAFISPNLAALISKRGGDGQAGGPILGGVLFIWQINAPYLLSGALLVALAVGIGWKIFAWRGVVGLEEVSEKT